MHISRSIVVEATPAKVMEIIRGPEGWADWHPDIKKVEAADFEDKQLLRVIFEDGDSVIEKLLGSDGMSFGYQVLAGQSSITGYQGTVTVVENGNQSLIVWNVNFEPLAPGCYESMALEFMEVGLDALAKRFT
jgi:carbon monoxide dehydrogenase subunit G